MKFTQYLIEEYSTRTEGYEIFINPTAKEIFGIKDAYVRCIADFEKKDLYVFSHTLIHDRAMQKLERSAGLHSWRHWTDTTSDANNFYVFFTATVQKDGKLKFYRSDTLSNWYHLIQLSTFKWQKMSDSWLNGSLGPGFIKTVESESEIPRQWK